MGIGYRIVHTIFGDVRVFGGGRMGLRSEFGRDHSAGTERIRGDIQALIRVARAAEEAHLRWTQLLTRAVAVGEVDAMKTLAETLEALPEHLK